MEHFFKLSTVLVIIFTANTISYGEDDLFTLDKKYRIDARGTIDMNTDDADIRIIGSDRKDVRIKVYRKVTEKGIGISKIGDFELVVRERDGDIVIREKTSSTWHVGFMGYTREDYRITIEAPRTVNLRIVGDDDDYFIKNMDAAISLNVDDGDAEFVNCKGTDFAFDLDDGTVRMDKGRGKLRIEMDDAEIYVENGNFSSVDADMDDAELHLATTLSDNGDYNFRSDDGYISLRVLGGGGEFDVRHDDSHVRSSDAFHIVVEKEYKTMLKLNGGTAYVRINMDDGNVKLMK